MYRIRIYSIYGHCREITVKSYDFAIERIKHYRNNWSLYDFATLAIFNECWIELPIEID